MLLCALGVTGLGNIREWGMAWRYHNSCAVLYSVVNAPQMSEKARDAIFS